MYFLKYNENGNSVKHDAIAFDSFKAMWNFGQDLLKNSNVTVWFLNRVNGRDSWDDMILGSRF